MHLVKKCLLLSLFKRSTLRSGVEELGSPRTTRTWTFVAVSPTRVIRSRAVRKVAEDWNGELALALEVGSWDMRRGGNTQVKPAKSRNLLPIHDLVLDVRMLMVWNR